ncbi:DUF938 domain-containing protein [Alteromonas aestuariivivens]|uniref:DUF938 domain-containing protein n=1 Tax=Alteromonas aestuariivivens TaxID=1938339 RepID=A0A3D8M651_9ALTE|nr:DUF938 domain-containing protein [Alteromonas aestuariivivens]RDV25101.1 DUF938 domain-containing protein [Alteromonas aestuariivivens]
MNKPFSQACENNKEPILEQLRRLFVTSSKVLEIGSGTGQHAVHFAGHLPHLQWHTSDQPDYHSGILAWLSEAQLPNLQAPVAFKIGHHAFPQGSFDAVFTANTAHIMQMAEVQTMMELVANALPPGGVFCQYGPFTQEGQFSSNSNAAFHARLLEQGYGGYRDLSELLIWANPMILSEVIDMPANNLMLVWCKQ